MTEINKTPGSIRGRHIFGVCLVFLFASLIISLPVRAGLPGLPLVPKAVIYALSKQMLSPSFFRHARWNTPEQRKALTVQPTETPMSMEEFEKVHPPISKERALEIHYILAVTQHLFQKHGIKALPVGGTMLGLLRNGGQLPHDDDADFAVKEADYDKIVGLGSELRQYGLKLRHIPGEGLQICPLNDLGLPGLMAIQGRNALAKVVGRLGLKISQRAITERGFIDIIPVAYDDSIHEYRYSGAYAKDIWYHQTIPEELMDCENSSYRFGPVRIQAPANREAMQKNILQVYNKCMTHVMATPDHRLKQDNLCQRLVRLTEDQKRPFPFQREDISELKRRLKAVGLDYQHKRGKVTPLEGFVPPEVVEHKSLFGRVRSFVTKRYFLTGALVKGEAPSSDSELVYKPYSSPGNGIVTGTHMQ